MVNHFRFLARCEEWVGAGDSTRAPLGRGAAVNSTQGARCDGMIQWDLHQGFTNHRIGLRENLQENPIFDGKNPWVSG